ncbi:MAG: DUF6786 family protein [Planctomycetota bacterium]|jgi:hypothetical protein
MSADYPLGTWIRYGLLWLAFFAAGQAGCSIDVHRTSYSDDVAFLQPRTRIYQLHVGTGRIAVAPGYQGRVMTSSFSADGLSLGWINRKDITAGERDVAFNNYGGQERFWLGPEGGQFSLYFKKNQPQSYDTWKVPEPWNKGPFEVIAADDSYVRMHKDVRVTSAFGTNFRIKVQRTIRTISKAEAEGLLNVGLPENLEYVGFVSENRITNLSGRKITPQTGAVSIWTLGMYPGRDGCVVIAPYHKQAKGPVANTDYFDQPASRVRLLEDVAVALFKADGKCISKLGLSGTRATDRLASMDFDSNILTIIKFTRPSGETRYVNNLMKKWQDHPYGGDCIISHNHHGREGLCFYEMESSSPAAFLDPGQSLDHYHRTMHFHGPLKELSKISSKVLGVNLQRVRKQMP